MFFASRLVLRLAGILGLAMALPNLLLIYLPAHWPLDAANHAVGRDFANLWVGGRLLAEGQWQALFDVPAYHAAFSRIFSPEIAQHLWSYPPTSFLLAAPLASLPYGLALAVWTLAGLAMFVGVACIGFATRDAKCAASMALMAPAALLNIVCGQNGFLTAACLGGGILLLDRRPVVAGVLIGLLSYKPHLGMVVAPVMLALGAWTAIASAAATALGMVLLSVALYGIEPWLAFGAITVPLQAHVIAAFQGFFVNMLVSPYAGFRLLGVPHASAMAMQMGVSFFVIVACALAVRRTRDAEIRLQLITAATFLATPYALTYDLPIIALVIARRFTRAPVARWPLPHAILYGGAWAAPLMSASFAVLGLPLVPALMAGLLYSACRPLLELGRWHTHLQDRIGLRTHVRPPTSSRL